jgi:hypothetical protein
MRSDFDATRQQIGLTGEFCVTLRINGLSATGPCGSLPATQLTARSMAAPTPPVLRAAGAALAALALGSPIGAWANPKPHQGEAVPALYATRAEAEQAAKQHFHCTGAHRMGNQWMPCNSHSYPNR